MVLDGRVVKSAASFTNGKLTVTFARAGNVAVVSLSSPALTVAKGAASKHKLILVLTVRSANGHISTYHLVTSAR